MKKKVFTAFAAFLTLLLLPSLTAYAEQSVSAKDIAGIWSANATLVSNTIEGTEPDSSVPISLNINENGTGTAEFMGIAGQLSYQNGVISASAEYTETFYNTDFTVTMSFSGTVTRDADWIIIDGQMVSGLEGASGSAVYAWTASKEAPPPAVESADEDDIPVLISSEQTQALPASEAEEQVPTIKPEKTETEPDSVPEEPDPDPEDEASSDPWQHAGKLATVLISAAAAIAAVLGGAVGAAGGAAGPTDEASQREPAYERAKVPEYPDYTTGQDGEHITRKSDGTIEVSYTGGEVAIHFPNGTIQVKNPDGSTWEEWPDGTVSATDSDGFVTKTTDGTLTMREPNGEETVYNPDGTSVHTNSKGVKVTRNATHEVVTAERDGFIGTKNPQDPDAVIITSPYGGNVVIREKAKTELIINAEGRKEQHTVYEPVAEGEMRLKNSSWKFKPDGSMDGKGDDGSSFATDKDGNTKMRTLEGDTYEISAEGDFLIAESDGTYIKGNVYTGEMDANELDGSYWRQDAEGNSSYYVKKFNEKGISRKDGYIKIENDNESITKYPDGTMERKYPDGSIGTQKPDGTITLEAPNGAKMSQRPDGTAFVQKPDGTVIPLKPDAPAGS